MNNEQYEKLTTQDKVKLANDTTTPKELIKKILEEDNMDLKMQLLMSSQAIMDGISNKK